MQRGVEYGMKCSKSIETQRLDGRKNTSKRNVCGCRYHEERKLDLKAFSSRTEDRGMRATWSSIGNPERRSSFARWFLQQKIGGTLHDPTK